MNLSNLSQIRFNGKDVTMAKLNGNVLYEAYDKNFYVEYELYPNDLPINYTYHSVYKANLPTLLLNVMDPSSEVKYSKIEITLNDDTITEDTNITAREVKSIKLWYPKETGHLMFIGSTEQSPNYIERLNFINVSNLKSYRLMFANSRYFITASFSNHFANSSHITDMSRMFYNCKSLGEGELIDQIVFHTIRDMDVSGVTDMSEMFYGCSYLSSIHLYNWDTRNVTESNDMFYGVNSSINFNYNGSNYKNWTLTEEQTGFSGTFPWSKVTLTVVGKCDDDEIYREVYKYPKGTVVNIDDIVADISIEGYMCDGASMSGEKTLTEDITLYIYYITYISPVKRYRCEWCGCEWESKDPDSDCPNCGSELKEEITE